MWYREALASRSNVALKFGETEGPEIKCCFASLERRPAQSNRSARRVLAHRNRVISCDIIVMAGPGAAETSKLNKGACGSNKQVEMARRLFRLSDEIEVSQA